MLLALTRLRADKALYELRLTLFQRHREGRKARGDPEQHSQFLDMMGRQLVAGWTRFAQGAEVNVISCPKESAKTCPVEKAMMTLRILLVDDEEADIIRFKRAAKKAGLQRRIDVCRTGADALSVLQSAVDAWPEVRYLLLSDLKMPIMMGNELVAHIRNNLGLAELPAFILSSSNSLGDVEQALLSGANGYILKCESEADYLRIVRWLEVCCREIDDKDCALADWRPSLANMPPPQVVAGPLAYSKVALN